jgi:hypothetical protein
MGDKEERAEAIEGETQVYVINYDAVRSDLVYSALRLKGFRSVIADESTMLKEGRTQRFRNLYTICRGIPFRTILTGKPITEKPEEIFAQLLFLDDGETFGKSFWRFRFTYFDQPLPWTPYKWKLKPQAGEIIARKISEKCIRVPEEELKAALPPKVYIPVYFEMSREARERYNQLKREFALELPSGKAFETQWVLTKTVKLHELCNGFFKHEDGSIEILDTSKAEWIIENLPSMLPRGPVLIWAHFRAILDVISSLLTKEGFAHRCYHGQMGDDERKESLEAFLGGEVDILALSQRAGYSSLNLQRANQNIFHDLDYSAMMRFNAEDRTHRIGSEKHVSVAYYDLLTKKTLDEVVLKIIKEKGDMAEAILAHIRT